MTDHARLFVEYQQMIGQITVSTSNLPRLTRNLCAPQGVCFRKDRRASSGEVRLEDFVVFGFKTARIQTKKKPCGSGRRAAARARGRAGGGGRRGRPAGPGRAGGGGPA